MAFSLLIEFVLTAPSNKALISSVPFVGALPQEFQYALDPPHQLGEQTVVMGVNLMDELVKVVLVTLA